MPETQPSLQGPHTAQTHQSGVDEPTPGRTPAGREASARPAQGQGRDGVVRRRMLAGLGAGALVAAITGPAALPAAAAGNSGIPVLKPGEDWAATLARTPQVQLVPGETYVLPGTVELPDGCVILGNGATVTVADDSYGALAVTARRDVTIRDVRFLGRRGGAVDVAPVFAHVGVRLDRSTNVRILDCDFTGWRGAGVAVTGSRGDDYFGYRVKLLGNAFVRCYFGVSLADRSEYSIAHDNSFAYCRLAIWNSSGNWNLTGNDVVGCHGAFYSMAASSPYGQLTSDNWGHGTVVGNTFNHSNGGTAERWTTQLEFPVGGSVQDPGPGVVVKGLLPPTFTGNTLWYTDIRAEDLVGTPWLLSGCTLSNLTISSTGGAGIHLVGTQANGAANLPRLVGNVKDLLAGLA